MKKYSISRTTSESDDYVIIACDVGKTDLNYYTEIGDNAYEKQDCSNNTIAIEEDLNGFMREAKGKGFRNCIVVAEATGQYHDNLFRTALRLGLSTALVNPESAAKMRMIESNDDNKTDKKDPKVIFRLASIGKTLRHRQLEKHYTWLRTWHHLYVNAEQHVVEVKCQIHAVLLVLFPDFEYKSDFVYRSSGAALFSIFNGSPYRIVEVGETAFNSKMKERVPRIKKATLKNLYSCAKASCRQNRDPREVGILERQMECLWQDYNEYSSRKEEVKKDMENSYRDLRSLNPKLPSEVKGVITTFHLSRLVAEIGPLNDFHSWRQLLKFAGMGLRERQSGQYHGKTKISKKGRAYLRKALGHIVLPLVKKKGLYGKYYHSKIAKNCEGTKAMAAVMRKFLKMFYGWYTSGLAFDRARVFTCQSEYNK